MFLVVMNGERDSWCIFWAWVNFPIYQYFGHHEKSQLLGKDPDAGKDWGQEEKGAIEDEMVGWHHWCNGHEFEQAPGVCDRQGSLECFSTCSLKESDRTVTELNWYACACVLKWIYIFTVDKYTHINTCTLVHLSYLVLSNSLWPHGLQHTRLPCPSHLPELAQTHVHWVSDAIQPSHPLPPSPPAFNLSQQQGLFKWVSSSHQVAKVLEFQLQHQSLKGTWARSNDWREKWTLYWWHQSLLTPVRA